MNILFSKPLLRLRLSLIQCFFQFSCHPFCFLYCCFISPNFLSLITSLSLTTLTPPLNPLHILQKVITIIVISIIIICRIIIIIWCSFLFKQFFTAYKLWSKGPQYLLEHPEPTSPSWWTHSHPPFPYLCSWWMSHQQLPSQILVRGQKRDSGCWHGCQISLGSVNAH